MALHGFDSDADDDFMPVPPDVLKRARISRVKQSQTSSSNDQGSRGQHQRRPPQRTIADGNSTYHSSELDAFEEDSQNCFPGSPGSAYAATNEARVGRAAPAKRAVGMHRSEVK